MVKSIKKHYGHLSILHHSIHRCRLFTLMIMKSKRKLMMHFHLTWILCVHVLLWFLKRWLSQVWRIIHLLERRIIMRWIKPRNIVSRSFNSWNRNLRWIGPSFLRRTHRQSLIMRFFSKWQIQFFLKCH